MRGSGRPALASLAASILALASPAAWGQSTQPAADGNQVVASETGQTSVTETKAAKAGAAKQSGWLSLGGTVATSSGNDQEAARWAQQDGDALGGVRGAGYTYKEGGWLLEATGRAVAPRDYGAEVELRKLNLGFVQAHYDIWPSYYNSSLGAYPYPPMVFKLSKDLVTTRRDWGVTAGWAPDKNTTVQVRTNRWEKEGDQAPVWGGQVGNTSDAFDLHYRYPLVTDMNLHRDTVGFDVLKKLGRFDLKLSLDVTQFDGSMVTPDKRFTTGGALAQTRYSLDYPNWDEIMPRISLAGDLIEKVLRFEYEGEYSHVRTDGTYNENAVDANGFPVATDRARNFINNTHFGELQETIQNFRFVYTPTDRFKMYLGFGFKYRDADHHSRLNEDTTSPPNGTIDRVTLNSTEDTRHIWMLNTGGEYRVFDWLVASADARWEHGLLKRRWEERQIVGGTSSFLWRTDEVSDRVEYGAALTAKPIKELKLIGRWMETIIKNDYDPETELIDGALDEEAFRGFVGDNDRRIDEFSFVAQYRPCEYVDATYKLAAKLWRAGVEQSDSKHNGEEESLVNSLRVTLHPVEGVDVAFFGSVQNYDVHTGARHRPVRPIPDSDGDYATWGIEPSVEVSKSLTLNGGFSQRCGYTGEVSESDIRVYGYRAYDVYAGAIYKINKVWTADFRYTFTTFNETGNSGTNDFDEHRFSAGLTARF